MESQEPAATPLEQPQNPSPSIPSATRRPALADLERVEPSHEERLADLLGEALAEEAQEQYLKDPESREARRLLLWDLNNLLSKLGAGAGSDVQSHFLGNPARLHSHLTSSLEKPVQVLVRAIPNRLNQWVNQRPPVDSPERPAWRAQGRFLLEQGRLYPES